MFGFFVLFSLFALYFTFWHCKIEKLFHVYYYNNNIIIIIDSEFCYFLSGKYKSSNFR
jgi:hypothetical protein